MNNQHNLYKTQIIVLEKYSFSFFVKIHAFRVKNFDMSKNEVLKKQAKNTKF